MKQKFLRRLLCLLNDGISFTVAYKYNSISIKRHFGCNLIRFMLSTIDCFPFYIFSYFCNIFTKTRISILFFVAMLESLRRRDLPHREFLFLLFFLSCSLVVYNISLSGQIWGEISWGKCESVCRLKDWFGIK